MRRATNVVVYLKPGESDERLLKRFSKKCKKTDIIKEHLEKTSFFRSKSEKKRQKRLRSEFLAKKAKK